MIVWTLPLKTVSEANCSEHWSKKSKRHRQQQFFIRALFSRENEEIKLPCTIKLIRISTMFLDSEENLPMAFKFIKDEIGACIFPEKIVFYRNKKGRIVQNKGHCDSDPRITWLYDQEKGPMGIKIEIESCNRLDLL